MYPFAKRPEAEVWRDAMRLYVAITRGRDEVRFPYGISPRAFSLRWTGSLIGVTGFRLQLQKMPIQAETVPDEVKPVESGEFPKIDVGEVIIGEADQQNRLADAILEPRSQCSRLSP